MILLEGEGARKEGIMDGVGKFFATGIACEHDRLGGCDVDFGKTGLQLSGEGSCGKGNGEQPEGQQKRKTKMRGLHERRIKG